MSDISKELSYDLIFPSPLLTNIFPNLMIWSFNYCDCWWHLISSNTFWVARGKRLEYDLVWFKKSLELPFVLVKKNLIVRSHIILGFRGVLWSLVCCICRQTPIQILLRRNCGSKDELNCLVLRCVKLT